MTRRLKNYFFIIKPKQKVKSSSTGQNIRFLNLVFACQHNCHDSVCYIWIAWIFGIKLITLVIVINFPIYLFAFIVKTAKIVFIIWVVGFGKIVKTSDLV